MTQYYIVESTGGRFHVHTDLFLFLTSQYFVLASCYISVHIFLLFKVDPLKIYIPASLLAVSDMFSAWLCRSDGDCLQRINPFYCLHSMQFTRMLEMSWAHRYDSNGCKYNALMTWLFQCI